MTQLIGLIGFKQSGKTTAAEHLESKGFERINFKDCLIDEIKQNFPDLLNEIKDNMELRGLPMSIDELFLTKPPLIRTLMQNYGTDVRRKDDSNYWVNEYLNKIISTPGSIVTDDVRFLNEADAIKNNGGKLIRIIREDITSGGDHVSETEHLKIKEDYIISVGYGDTQGLYDALDFYINALK